MPDDLLNALVRVRDKPIAIPPQVAALDAPPPEEVPTPEEGQEKSPPAETEGQPGPGGGYSV
jgi:hypothetical protein